MMAYVERFTAHEKASQNSGALPSRTRVDSTARVLAQLWIIKVK